MEDGERKILLVCGKCGNNDIDSDVLLEIDFKNEQMVYVCRKCTYENILKLKAIPATFPTIGVGR